MLLMYLMYFVVDTLLFQLLAKHSSAAFHVSNLLTSVCKHVNDMSVYYSYTTVSFAIIELFSLFNAMAKTNHIDSTSPLHYL